MLLLCGFLLMLFCFYMAAQDASPAEDLWGAAGIVVAVFLVVGSIVAVANQISFPSDMAELSQLRRGVASVDCRSYSASQIFGKAVEANQQIATSRYWNSRWYADNFYPDGWDTVTVLTIPSCQ